MGIISTINNYKDKATNKIAELKNTAEDKAKEFLDTLQQKKNEAAQAVASNPVVKSGAGTINNIKANAAQKISSIKSNVVAKGNAVDNKIDSAKKYVENKAVSLKRGAETKLNSIKSDLTKAVSTTKTSVTPLINSAKSSVSGYVQNITPEKVWNTYVNYTFKDGWKNKFNDINGWADKKIDGIKGHDVKTQALRATLRIAQGTVIGTGELLMTGPQSPSFAYTMHQKMNADIARASQPGAEKNPFKVVANDGKDFLKAQVAPITNAWKRGDKVESTILGGKAVWDLVRTGKGARNFRAQPHNAPGSGTTPPTRLGNETLSNGSASTKVPASSAGKVGASDTPETQPATVAGNSTPQRADSSTGVTDSTTNGKKPQLSPWDPRSEAVPDVPTGPVRFVPKKQTVPNVEGGKSGGGTPPGSAVAIAGDSGGPRIPRQRTSPEGASGATTGSTPPRTSAGGVDNAPHNFPTEADVAEVRATRYKGATEGTVAVGRTNVEGLENEVFAGASAKARTPDDTPDPNRPIQGPDKGHGFDEHAEEDVLNKFSAAAERVAEDKGISPSEIRGTLFIRQDNPNGVCGHCTSGLKNPGKADGIFAQFSEKFPNVEVVVVSNGNPTGLRGTPEAVIGPRTMVDGKPVTPFVTMEPDRPRLGDGRRGKPGKPGGWNG